VVRIEHQLALQAANAKIFQLNAELEQKVRERTSELEAVIEQLGFTSSLSTITDLATSISGGGFSAYQRQSFGQTTPTIRFCR
jgi:hypothetical protein